MTWQERASRSHYQTAVAIGQELQAGNVPQARAGLEELIEALSRSEKRALKSQLIRLMTHVIKWKTQTKDRPRSWSASIQNAREEIKDIQEETPSLTDDVVRAMWDKCLGAAKRDAEGETNQEISIAG